VIEKPASADALPPGIVMPVFNGQANVGVEMNLANTVRQPDANAREEVGILVVGSNAFTH